MRRTANLFLLVAILLVINLPFACFAQNPIIRDQFTGDPTARVFKNKVYLYPSHDIKPPVGQRQDWFCMEDYHVFSSENLTDWTDHGVIVTQNKVPWVRPDSYSMWAPDCIERNGKYYFYFPSALKDGRGFGIGVAIADSPEGPFVPEPENIKGISGIDPCVLQASDGNAYIFWGNGRCAKLKPNMKEIADDTPKETVKFGEREFEVYGVNCLKDLPNRQAEGTFAFEYKGNYYLSYSYVKDKTEVLGYAMSKNPMGPYEYKGLIMAEHANGCWTNHHSIVNYKGQWYLFYHQNAFSPRDDKRRSVQIEKLFFNPDGTIQEVRPTMRGVGINKATEKIEIDRYSSASNDVTTTLIDTLNTFRSYQATLPAKGSWLKYKDIDFSNLPNAYLTICAKANDHTTLFVREKTDKGKVIATIDLSSNTGGRWTTINAPLEYIPKGVTDLVITSEGKSIDIDWIQFKKGIMPGYDIATKDKPTVKKEPVQQIAKQQEPKVEPKKVEKTVSTPTPPKVTITNVDKNIPVSGQTDKNTFVVVIGNEKYADEADVPFAENDAKMMREYCQQTLGVSEKHIRCIYNATYNDFRKALSWLKQGLTAYSGNGRVIFYYAGHGIPDEADKSAYLLPVDGIGSDIESAYSLNKLYQSLSELPAQSVTVFLDACFSGSKREGGMMASARGVAIKAKPQQAMGKMVVFTAAQGDETAYPLKSQKHGLFTYFLLKKLQETKGNVTLGELSDYLTDAVKRESFDENNKIQTPSVNASSALANSWRSMKLR